MKIPLEAVVKELLSRDRNQRWRKTLIKKKKGLISKACLHQGPFCVLLG